MKKIRNAATASLKLGAGIAGAILLSMIAAQSGSKVRAETLIVEPDPCPAPAAVYVIGAGDVLAVDLNPGREAAEGVLVFYSATAPHGATGWARRRLFSRFALAPAPAAGEPPSAYSDHCGRAPSSQSAPLGPTPPQ